jgi:Icc-related predicted phosphoesterase
VDPLLPRIYFATDVHGSDLCWKKFIAASQFYEANLLILGGDMTGKALVPIVAEKNSTHTTDFQDNHLVMKTEDDTAKVQKKISDKGYYPIRVERGYYDELSADSTKLKAWINETFNKLMAERVSTWMNYADTKLKDSDVRCFVCPGNDDMFDIDALIQESATVTNAEGKLLEVGGDYEMISTGWSTPTPWKTYRECSEEELGKKISEMTNQLKNPAKSIFNFHDPPVKSGLDDAPDLTEDLDIKGGGRITKSVGSVAVREAIEVLQPLLGLHGHIHESKGIAKIGRTVCINPGSVYEEGTLMGAIADLDGGKLKQYFVTAG